MADRTGTRDASRPRRWFRTGLLVGAAVPLPAAVLALSVPAAERLAPLLVPGALLLRPLSSAMAGWNGALNVLLVSVVNGVVFGAAAAALAARRRAPRRDSVRSRVRARTVVLAALALLVAAAIAVSVLAARHAERAARDLHAVALDAGFDGASEVRVSYPFLTERLGLVSRNEEPFPYGYASLDLEVDGCHLYGVQASVLPHTRSWLPRRVDLQGLRFQLEHTEPGTAAFRRVEFRTAGELRDRIAATAPGVEDPLCRLHSPYGRAGSEPVPARPAQHG